MGIPRFFGEVIRSIDGVLLHQLPNGTSSLSIDMGGLIHKAKDSVYKIDENLDRRLYEVAMSELNSRDPIELKTRFHQEVERLILQAVDIVNPHDVLVLAFDGVAPRAKGNQQRERREKTAKLPKLGPLDGNALSPGTEFMRDLDSSLKLFLARNKIRLPPTVIYSSHMVPGEGEHKIMEYYRNGTIAEYTKPETNHVIYGLDADLILLSLISPLTNLFICREDASEVVDIEALKRYLKDSVPNATNERDVLADFTVMMSLLGNDFLPHSPLVGRLGKTVLMMWDVYKSGNYELTKAGGVDFQQLRYFIEGINARQNELILDALKEQDPVRDANKNKMLTSSVNDNGDFDLSEFTDKWYNHCLGPRNEVYANRIEELTGFSLSPSPNDVMKMCLDYCRTIDWVYRYYSGGTDSVSQSWGYPYHHTPLLPDVYLALDGITSLGGTVPGPIPEPDFTIVHQLLMILPPSSVKLVPAPYQKLMMLGSHLSDMYPRNFESELLGTDLEHMAIPMIPVLTGQAVCQRVRDAVASILVNSIDAKDWMKSTDMIIQRTEAEIKAYDWQFKKIQKERDAKFKEAQIASEARGAERDQGGFVGGGRNQQYERRDGTSRGGRNQQYERRDGTQRGGRNQQYERRDGTQPGGRNQQYERRDGTQRRGRNQQYERRDGTQRGGRNQQYERRDTYKKIERPLETTTPFDQKLPTTVRVLGTLNLPPSGLLPSSSGGAAPLGGLKPLGTAPLGGLKSPGTVPLGGLKSPSAAPLGGLKPLGTAPLEGLKSPGAAPLGGLKPLGTAPLGGLKSPGTAPLGGLKSPGAAPLGGLKPPGTAPLGGLKSPGAAPLGGLKSPGTAPLGGLKSPGTQTITNPSISGLKPLNEGAIRQSDVTQTIPMSAANYAMYEGL